MLIDFNSLYVQVSFFCWGGVITKLRGLRNISFKLLELSGVESAMNRNYQFTKTFYILVAASCLVLERW